MTEIWGRGSNLFWTVSQMLLADKPLMAQYCNTILNPHNIELLAASKFDLAVVDLMFNECGLALTHHLNIPSVGYWAFSFASGIQEFTTMEAPPSFVPAMMSYLRSEMTFLQRTWNMISKLSSRMFMIYHASIVGMHHTGHYHYYQSLTAHSTVQCDALYQTVCWQYSSPPPPQSASWWPTSVASSSTRTSSWTTPGLSRQPSSMSGVSR